MKFIHLSDLHLGKRLNEYSMLEEQGAILEQILSIVDAETPDGVLIAGDVYDKSVPSAEAVVLEQETLEEVWRILQDFSYEVRQVFLMRLEGMAFRDIGLALGKTENWARVTYFRVKSKILQEMEGER
jgi:DNA-directed RNA polymerase specialized sigma24 family protein